MLELFERCQPLQGMSMCGWLAGSLGLSLCSLAACITLGDQLAVFTNIHKHTDRGEMTMELCETSNPP